jgi:hypothetical protein
MGGVELLLVAAPRAEPEDAQMQQGWWEKDSQARSRATGGEERAA